MVLQLVALLMLQQAYLHLVPDPLTPTKVASSNREPPECFALPMFGVGLQLFFASVGYLLIFYLR